MNTLLVQAFIIVAGGFVIAISGIVLLGLVFKAIKYLKDLSL